MTHEPPERCVEKSRTLPTDGDYSKVSYELVTSTDPCKFVVYVDQMIEAGWKPLGGVAVTPYLITDLSEGHVWAQAMVRGKLAEA